MLLSQILLALKARLMLITAIFVFVVGGAVVLSVILPKKYEASTSLVVDIRASDPVTGGGVPAQFVPGYMATQAGIINSDRVARRVVGELRLDEMAAFRERWLEKTQAKTDIVGWISSLLKKSLEVRPSRDNNILTISYTSTDAEFSARVANAFAKSYIETLLELKVEPAKQYADWFKQQNTILREKLEEAQVKLSSYQKEHGLVLLGGQLDVESAKLAELTRQLAVAQGQLVESSSRVADSEISDVLPEVMQNSLISSMKADLARLNSQYQQSRERLGENHPELGRMRTEIASLNAQIKTEIARVVSALDTSNKISESRQRELANTVEEQKNRVLQLKAKIDTAELLQRDVDSANRAYELIGQRLSQVNLESQNQHTNVAVLTPAHVPYLPTSPRLLLNVVLASIFGLFASCSIALLMELRNPLIRHETQLSELSNLVVVTTVKIPKNVKKHLAASTTGPCKLAATV